MTRGSWPVMPAPRLPLTEEPSGGGVNNTAPTLGEPSGAGVNSTALTVRPALAPPTTIDGQAKVCSPRHRRTPHTKMLVFY